MQEIRNARQERSAQNGNRKEYRCRVCDGPVEWPDLVCRKCWQRDREEQEWESYLDFLDGDDTAPGNPESSADDCCSRSVLPGRLVLIVLCGPSHAGKTTFTQKLHDSFAIVSSDEIRSRLGVGFQGSQQDTKLWGSFQLEKCKELKAVQNVVLDACHMSKKARRHALQGVDGRYEKICVVFDLPLRTVQARCLEERRVSLSEVERMWRAFQKGNPSAEELRREGFDEVYSVRE